MVLMQQKLNKWAALTLQAADRLPDSSSSSHFALGEDAGVKTWAVSSAECSLIHLRLLNNQNELEQKSCHNRGAFLLYRQEHFTNQMWACVNLPLYVTHVHTRMMRDASFAGCVHVFFSRWFWSGVTYPISPSGCPSIHPVLYQSTSLCQMIQGFPASSAHNISMKSRSGPPLDAGLFFSVFPVNPMWIYWYILDHYHVCNTASVLGRYLSFIETILYFIL